jgi:hypothetical protein
MGDGTCACFEGWTGAYCNITESRKCAVNIDCGLGLVCDAGKCLCAGNFGGETCGETCGCGKFGGEECSAPTCDIDATCSGNGR